MSEFPNPEDWLIAYLGDVAPVYTVSPDVIDRPIIKVNRTGGGQDMWTDRPTLAVDVFVPEGPTSARAEAFSIANEITNRIWRAGGKTAGDVLCDAGRVDMGARLIPDQNTKLRRVVLDVTLSFRRH